MKDWDVSLITDMSDIFKNKMGNRNPDLSQWDVSQVTTMSEMFKGTGNPTTFTGAGLSTWVVSQVTTMKEMFAHLKSFNEDISGWDVSQVTDMYSMFAGANIFNQDLSAWNVGRVTNMNVMFVQATAFNQSLCGQSWVESSASKSSMFHGAGENAEIAAEVCHCAAGEHNTVNSAMICAYCPNGFTSNKQTFNDPLDAATATECTPCGDGDWSAPIDGKVPCSDRNDFTLRQLEGTACTGKIDPSECDFSNADSSALSDAVRDDPTAYQMAGLCN